MTGRTSHIARATEQLAPRKRACPVEKPAGEPTDSGFAEARQNGTGPQCRRPRPPSQEPLTLTLPPAPTPTPTPSPSGAVLSASVLSDSTWAGGFCRSFKVANSGSATSTGWRLTFTLPSTVAITQSWSGSATRSGNTVTVTPEAWAAKVAPGSGSASFGFCASGNGEPTAVAVREVASSTATVASAASRSSARSRARLKAKRIQQARRHNSLRRKARH